MSNDKVQAGPPVRKSVIRKSIQRTLSTAKFEGIVIHDEIEETIEWTTLEERQRKIKNWETLLLTTFKKSHDNILGELGLSHKKAYGVDYLDKDTRPEVTDRVATPGDNQSERQGYELDGLDTI